MGFLSLFGKKPGASSTFLSALKRGQQRPLDIATCCRLVIASPKGCFFFDVPLDYVSTTVRDFQAAGIDAARSGAAQVMGNTLNGSPPSRPDLLRQAALAYFDLTYLASQPWNTLGLDISIDGTEVKVSRGIFHLQYPA